MWVVAATLFGLESATCWSVAAMVVVVVVKMRKAVVSHDCLEAVAQQR